MSERTPSNERKSISLLVKFARGDGDDYLEKYATNLSSGGMFIWSREAEPVGTVLNVRVEVAGGARVLQGKTIVRWARPPNSPHGPPGMGLEFTELDAASAALIDRLLASDHVPAAPPTGGPAEAGAALPGSPLAAASKSASGSLAAAAAAAVSVSASGSFSAGAPVSASAAGAFSDGTPVGAAERAVAAAMATSSLMAPETAASRAVAAAMAMVSGPASAPVAKASAPGPARSALVEAANAAEPTQKLRSPIGPRGVAGWSAGLGQPATTALDPSTASARTPVAAAPLAPVAVAAAPEEARLESQPLPMAAVEVDFDVLIEDTPEPAAEATVIVDQSLYLGDVAAIEPTLLRKRPEPAPLPRGVLKPEPIRRSPRKRGVPVYLKARPELDDDVGGPLVGIDLGTTNSCCAVLSGGKPIVLKTKEGYNIIPSLIALNAQDKLVVGHAARAQMLLNPQQCIYGAKRLVGRDYDSPTVNLVRERFHYEIVAGLEGKAAVMLGGKVVSLDEVQALVLNECRLMAEAFLAMPVRRAVVTCPAYYSEQQREAVRRAGLLAGLKIERILNEPTAAALAYGLNRELSRKVLVYDVGGGSFDATLLRIEKNVFEVLATGGDVFLGGLDFDNQVIAALLMKFQAQNGVAFIADSGSLARVADQAERAKIALSERSSVEVDLPMLQVENGVALGLKTTLSRQELERLTAGLVERTLEVVGDVLLDAQLKASDIDEVVLVGGMSRMPLVRDKLKAMFKKPPHASVNAEEAIAVGAALYTGSIDKVSNLVLIDVVPMTLGLGLPGGAFKRLISRNTPLPASASFGFATTEDNEETIEVQVFQGEDSDVSVNDYLGTVHVDGLPRLPKGLVKVAINLRLDAQCVLHVEAREMHTRRLFASTLATRYTTGEVQQKLGIPTTRPTAAAAKRAEELERRGGKFWQFMKKVIRR